jgi:hypothetical protein
MIEEPPPPPPPRAAHDSDDDENDSVGLYKLKSADPQLESAWFQPTSNL